MNYYVDAHCHLDLIRNIQSTVSIENLQPIKSITVTNAPFIYQPCKSLFGRASNIRVALGMHPELIPQYAGQLDQFQGWLSDTKYIGEIGMDGPSRFKESYALQKKVFVEILTLCRKANKKILTIHSRNAVSDIIAMLNENLSGAQCQVILHWYSGSLIELNRAVQLGFYFSINHKMVITDKGKQLIKAIPNHLLLTETDAPFTFDDKITNRLQSLEQTIKGIAAIILHKG